MRRVEHLLKRIRQPTDNLTEVTDTAGLNDDELIEALNDAQEYLQQELEAINDEPFTRESFISSVARQEAYDLPVRVYLGQNVRMVEFSTTGQAETFRKLRQIDIHERRSVQGGFFPQYYTIRNKQILLSPFPSTTTTNGIRLNAVQQVPKLDKRRAKIADIEIDETTGAVNELTLEVDDYTTFFPGASAFAASSILVDDRFCLVDSDGNILARNIPIRSIEEDDTIGAGVCEVGPYTPETALDGDDFDLNSPDAEPVYLVAGADATTHSELPLACESYLITWGKWQILERDGMFEESQKMQMRLEKLEVSLKGAWYRISDDVTYIPILNSDYLFA